MKKTIIILVIGLVILSAGAFFYFNNQKSNPEPEQVVLEKTLEISQQYADLRYRTDNVLINAKSYADYDEWNNDLTDIIKDWEELEKSATNLEELADKMAQEKLSLNFVKTAHAYTKEDVTNIIDKAPVGKKIMTLANHFGVDAKMAQLILNQSQDEVSREAYGEEGDVFAKCENGAMRIKNGAKVTVFVGTIVATGGTAALATSGALAQTAVVVSGADLVLEVTEDEARIALGDKNKVSSLVSKVRTITEPVAGILTIANIPGNMSKAIDKFGIVSFGADQIRSVVQDEKILGISIKTQSNGELKAEIAGLTPEELPQWQQENNAPDSTQSEQEIIEQYINVPEIENNSNTTDVETESQSVDEPQETESSNNEQTTSDSIPVPGIAGTYSGSATLIHVEDDVEAPDSLPVTLQLNEAGTGTANVKGYSGEAHYAGSAVSFSVTMKEDGAVVNCAFDGRATRNGSQVVISGDMHFSMMGVTFATYTWSAQK